MNVRAHARFVRHSPSKVRQVLNLIRGHHVPEARAALDFSGRRAADPVRKALESALATAEHNFALDAEELIVAEAYADEGPTLKRFRPRARGRATQILKRTSHITVVVSDEWGDDEGTLVVAATEEDEE
jgi:large subunit ribosomal protein L22